MPSSGGRKPIVSVRTVDRYESWFAWPYARQYLLRYPLRKKRHDPMITRSFYARDMRTDTHTQRGVGIASDKVSATTLPKIKLLPEAYPTQRTKNRIRGLQVLESINNHNNHNDNHRMIREFKEGIEQETSILPFSPGTKFIQRRLPTV